ncbi:MAG TPA: anti-sigma factor [Thermoanaerobaculia bacterium]|nr:anti-sigma factor [Thermoanaerobaculia bacterium]
MNVDLSPEDRTILAALEAGGDEPPMPTEADETLARLYTEVLGLVPCELEPAAPRPEIKSRLLSIVRGDETLPGDETQEMEPRPAPVVVSAPVRPAPVPVPRPSREVPAARGMAMSARRRSVWPMALAATLILALGALCGWLFLRQARMEETIASLERAMDTQRQEAEQSVAGMQAAMERMRVNFALVTAPAVKVSPLRPVDPQSQARGILFVAADNQHWYLAVHELPPAPPGRDYQLWWVAQEGRFSGGVFDPGAGEKVELYSETMPAGTRDVVITLEPARGVSKPTGPEVLRAAGVFYQL